VKNALKEHQTTPINPLENPWWTVFEHSLSSFDESMIVDPMVFPAATDSRFLRALGIKALGFSPIRRSPILLHEHDEYLSDSVFLEGCAVYVPLIKSLSSQLKFLGE
jgi:aminoacylase